MTKTPKHTKNIKRKHTPRHTCRKPLAVVVALVLKAAEATEQGLGVDSGEQPQPNLGSHVENVPLLGLGRRAIRVIRVIRVIRAVRVNRFY